MDLMTLLENRYSVRKFKPEPISQDTMTKILKAGHFAPTACNNQPQKVFVLQSEDALAKLRKCTRCHFGCTAALLVCGDSERAWVRKYDGKDSLYVDASIVTTHMMLAAEEEDVGTCWVMYFDPNAVRCEFELPEHLEPVAILVMGYPAEDSTPGPLHSQFRAEEELVAYL